MLFGTQENDENRGDGRAECVAISLYRHEAHGISVRHLPIFLALGSWFLVCGIFSDEAAWIMVLRFFS